MELNSKTRELNKLLSGSNMPTKRVIFLSMGTQPMEILIPSTKLTRRNPVHAAILTMLEIQAGLKGKLATTR